MNKKLLFFLLMVSFQGIGQYWLKSKTETLQQLNNIHNTELNIPTGLDSLELAQLALDFIKKYEYGEPPSHLVYNKLNHSKADADALLWVSNFLSNPLPPMLKTKVQLALPLDKFVRWTQQYEASRFILVNIAGNQLFAYENDSIALQMKVIVGTKKNQTPVMATYADAVMLYPYWTPTANIVFNEIIPKVIENKNYLKRNNFEVLDRNNQLVNPTSLDWKSFSRGNFPYTIRQGTGCDNSLGLLKINIQNPLSIYMHDTPHTSYSKGLFDREKRFFSHGCIRLEKPLELANWLRPKRIIDEALMEKCLINQQPEVIPLSENVPVFLMYFTDFLDENGVLVKVADFYGLEE